jgi:tetratricopeptide (TPR) repeat protein
MLIAALGAGVGLLQGKHEFAAMWLLAGISILVVSWISNRREGADTPTLRRLFESVPQYQCLMQIAPGATLSCDPTARTRPFVDEREAAWFSRCIVFRQQVIYWASDEDLQRSGIPDVVLISYGRIIDFRIQQALQDLPEKQQLLVQVGVALLPGCEIDFDIAVIAPHKHKMDSGGDVQQRLAALLQPVRGWPVGFPVVFAVQRSAILTDERLNTLLIKPFLKWIPPVMESESMTYAELALATFDVDLPEEPPGFTVDDLEALATLLPDSVPLQMAFGSTLRVCGRHEEALEVYQRLLDHNPADPCVVYHRITCLAELGQLERAAAACQAWIRESPGDVWAYALLARLQLDMNCPAECLSTLEKAFTLRASAELYHIRAAAHAALEDHDRAISDLNIAIFRDRDLAAAYRLRAQLRLHRGQPEETLSDLRQLERCAGRTLESVHLQAAALIKLGRASEAEQVYQAALQQAPGNPWLQLDFARMLALIGKLALARDECTAAIAGEQCSSAGYALRSTIELEMHNFEAAAADAGAALARDPGDIQALLIRGLARTELGDSEAGLMDLAECAERAPDHGLARLHRGRLLYRMQEYQAAIEEFTGVLDIAPGWTDARLERGYAYLGVDDVERALEDFQSVIAHAPTRGDAYTGRALTSLIKGNRAAAAEDLNKALVLDPSDVCGRLNRALLLLNQHEDALAREDLDEVLAAAPDHAEALYHRAHLHLMLGRFVEARRDFDRLIEMYPDQPQPYLGRSIALENIGDAEQAEADFEDARQLAPFSTHELALSRALLAASVADRNEDFEKAIELASQVIDEHPDAPADAYRLRGHAYWYTENYVEALEDFSHAIDVAETPSRFDFSACGQVLAELGDFERAIEFLDHAVQLARDAEDTTGLAFSLNGRGRALAGLERYQEAEQEFAESLKLKPDNAWLHFNRGLMYIARQLPEKSTACFELALRVDSPKLPPCKRRRAEGFLDKAHAASGSTEGESSG